MHRPSARERLHQLALASMPPGPYVCILCQGEPAFVGAGLVDGTVMAYHVCEQCATIDYSEAVTAKIRAWRFSRQRN